jgi:hypothetical protein
LKGFDEYGFINGIDKIGVNVPQFIRKNAITITDWEANGRYDVHFSIRINSLEKYYHEIYAWYRSIWNSGTR